MSKGKKKAPEDALSYVQRVAPLMGLSGWTFVVADEPSEDEHLAEVEVVYGQKLATVYVCDGWYELDKETKRGTIVHELLHCHFNRFGEAIYLLFSAGNDTLCSAGRKIWSHEEEYLVEELAQAWAPFLPEPLDS